MLAAWLEGLGCVVDDFGICSDCRPMLAKTLSDAAIGHDLIVTSGAVSTGEEDHVRGAIERLGTLHFWRLAIKPGKLVALSQIGGVPLIGLPGNPVAVLVTFAEIARPMILKLAGAALAPLSAFRFASVLATARSRARATICGPSSNTTLTASSRSNTRMTGLRSCPRSCNRMGSSSWTSVRAISQRVPSSILYRSQKRSHKQPRAIQTIFLPVSTGLYTGGLQRQYLGRGWLDHPVRQPKLAVSSRWKSGPGKG
jgi:molybdenum cofactor synthesis domain-containing protein